MPKVTKNLFRFDRGELRPAKRTDEGYLVLDGYIARPGIYVYRNQDGSLRRELVPEATLSSKSSLDSLRLKPVTNNHPDPSEHPEMVTRENVQDLSVGTTGETVEISSDGRPRFTMTLQHEDAIVAAESGKVHLSPGYRCDLRWESGDHPNFGKYDAIQENRVYNHLALVDQGRGGAAASIRMDGAAQITDDVVEDKEEVKMDPIEALVEYGFDKADATRLVEEGADVLIKADKYDALPTDEDVKAEAAKVREARVKLDSMATDLKMDADETVKLDNDELKAAILEAADVKVPHVDGIDEAAAVKFTWASFEAGYTAPEQEVRQDDDDSDEGDDDVEAFRFDGKPESMPGLTNLLNRYDSRNVRK
jgi:hypothetical protein